jgi:two-component system, OmpR family, response regulator
MSEAIMEATVIDPQRVAGGAGGRPAWLGVTAQAARPLQAAPAHQPHILVAGDDTVFGLSISEYLRDKRLRVTNIPYGESVLAALDKGVVDLVLLAPPPEVDIGAVLAPRLREECSLPIIVVTDQREETDRIMALELGADDCLSAPFSPRELLARIRAILRRRRVDSRQRSTRGPRAYRFGAWELNLNTRRLQAADARQVRLSNGEFNLLVALLAAGERTLSRMQLLELSRLHDDEVYDRAVDVAVMRLRRKLEADTAAPRYLLTVRGAGYGIGVPVEAVY